MDLSQAVGKFIGTLLGAFLDPLLILMGIALGLLILHTGVRLAVVILACGLLAIVLKRPVYAFFAYVLVTGLISFIAAAFMQRRVKDKAEELAYRKQQDKKRKEEAKARSLQQKKQKRQAGGRLPDK